MKYDSRAERDAVRGFLAALSPRARARVVALRRAIRASAPHATGGFSYRMPVFRVGGRPLLWVGAFQRHVSLYPMTAAVKSRLAAALASHDHAQGTIRFALDAAPPERLVARIVRVRLRELANARPVRRKAPVETRSNPGRRS